MRYRKPPTPLVLVACLPLLAACSPDPQTEQAAGVPEAAAQANAAVIEGITWQRLAPQAQSPVATIRFDGGRVQGFGGCNQFGGGYRIDGDRVRIEALAATMMACEPEVMEAESAFLAALGGVDQVLRDADRLTLASVGQGSPRLVFERAPPPSLGGVEWEVTGFNNGRQAVVGPLVGTVLRLSFEDGVVTGQAGCNRFRAGYEQDGNSLGIEAPAATRMHCDAEGVMEQEQQFLAALESATTWSIERGMLDMHRADGERVLMAIRAVDQ